MNTRSRCGCNGDAKLNMHVVSLLKSVLLQEKSPFTFPASLCRDGAMDESNLEQQVASVGRGITFLEQEHLAMLTGLQLEITHLKRRCQGEPSSC